MRPAIQAFRDFYANFSPDSLDRLNRIYAPDVIFEDPAHRIEGLQALEQYFRKMMKAVKSCAFDIHSVSENGHEAWMRWEMTFVHPRLNRGAPVRVPGATCIRVDDHVVWHRDYFDMGAMVYEQLPVLGRAIRAIKRGLGQ
jgi:limonene-1,2-epoxide hydrolase